METNHKDQKASKAKTELNTNAGMPDRHYRNNDAESPDMDDLDGHDPISVAEEWRENSDIDNGNQNYQNHDSISRGLRGDDE